MHIHEWDEQYRAGDSSAQPAPLVEAWARQLKPGQALDLACGAGRNAVLLADQGWQVTAVDGSVAAIEILKSRSPSVIALVADLARHEFKIQPESWDLIVACCYLQRDLFPAIRAGLKPGGVALVIVNIASPGEQPTYKRASPGELRGFFEGWEILHSHEDSRTAEIVARRALSTSSVGSPATGPTGIAQKP